MIFTSALILLLTSCQSDDISDFNTLMENVSRLKENASYAETIALMENQRGKFPGNQFEISKELASLYRKIGQYEKCMDIWKNGHQQGFFYGIFPHFPIYEPFKQFDTFIEIVAEDGRLRKEATEKSKTSFKIVLPATYNSNQTYPLLIILHGGGSSIELAKKYWKSPILNKDYILVFIQSYMFLDMKTYSWGIKDERTRKEIRECFDSIIYKYPIDMGRVIISGMSAGGYTAMDIAIHEILPVGGFVAVCPETEPGDYAYQHILNTSSSGLKGVIISGEQDYFLTQQKKVYELLKKAGMPIRFEIINDLGHEYPKNFEVRIDSAIEYILTTFPILKGEYLEQKKPGKIPEIFAPGIISTSGKEFAGTFSPDGKAFYFTRSGGDMNLKTNTIMVTKIEDGYWSEPKIASFSGLYFDFEPHITPDGEKLYFGSRRPFKDNGNSFKMHQWYLEKNTIGWSTPKPLGVPFDELPVMYISVALNGNLYFSVDTKEAGIWFSKLVNGSYNKPVKLSERINCLPAVLHPFIDPDENFILFDAQPHGHPVGPDLFISFRTPDGSWTKSESMGDKINVSREMCPSLSPDGRFLFFSRDGDIYWVDAEIIQDIKNNLPD
jgi:predicted esterase